MMLFAPKIEVAISTIQSYKRCLYIEKIDADFLIIVFEGFVHEFHGDKHDAVIKFLEENGVI